jgi:hypothetical protein
MAQPKSHARSVNHRSTFDPHSTVSTDRAVATVTVGTSRVDGIVVPASYRAGGWAMLAIHPIESPIEGREVAMAKGQKRSKREKKKPKQDKNKKKGGETPSPFAVKLGTSYMNQYGKKN